MVVQVCDLPVRTAKFVARKNWVVTGSDDMMLRVFNYNTLERVHMFEAHSDYLRCCVVHPTQSFVLTSSGRWAFCRRSVTCGLLHSCAENMLQTCLLLWWLDSCVEDMLQTCLHLWWLHSCGRHASDLFTVVVVTQLCGRHSSDLLTVVVSYLHLRTISSLFYILSYKLVD